MTRENQSCSARPRRRRDHRTLPARENGQVNVKDRKQVADVLRELLEQIEAGEVQATAMQVAFIRGALLALPQ